MRQGSHGECTKATLEYSPRNFGWAGITSTGGKLRGENSAAKYEREEMSVRAEE